MADNEKMHRMKINTQGRKYRSGHVVALTEANKLDPMEAVTIPSPILRSRHKYSGTTHMRGCMVVLPDSMILSEVLKR